MKRRFANILGLWPFVSRRPKKKKKRILNGAHSNRPISATASGNGLRSRGRVRSRSDCARGRARTVRQLRTPFFCTSNDERGIGTEGVSAGSVGDRISPHHSVARTYRWYMQWRRCLEAAGRPTPCSLPSRLDFFFPMRFLSIRSKYSSGLRTGHACAARPQFLATIHTS